MDGLGWYLLGMGGLGCVGFTLLLAGAAASGMFDGIEDFERRFRRPRPSFALGVLVALAFIVGFPALAVVPYAAELPTFGHRWLASYVVFQVVNLYDLLVIDLLVVVWWHPAFLHIPDAPYFTTARPHVVGFFRGSLLGALTSAGSAAIVAWAAAG